MAEVKLVSPLAGAVWDIEVEVGDSIVEGQSLLIIESMKMELPVQATHSGEVKELLVSKGDGVTENQVLAILETG